MALTDALDLNSVTNLSSLSNLELAGEGSTLQPLFHAANNLVAETHVNMIEIASDLGVAGIMKAVTDLGSSVGPGYIGVEPNPYGPSNLVTDVLNLPSDVLAGDVDGIVQGVADDVSQIGTNANGLVDVVVSGPDPSNPIPEILDGFGGSLSNPILSAGEGSGGPLRDIGGGLLNGAAGVVAGDLDSNSSGHLIDVEIGPSGAAGSGFAIDVLASNPGGSSNPLDVNVIDVGSDGPTLLDASLLGDGGLLESGQDSLVGSVLVPLGGGSAGNSIADGSFSGTVCVAEDVLDLGGGGLLGGNFTHGLLQDVA